jgi:phage terminase large subunit-like protein
VGPPGDHRLPDASGRPRIVAEVNNGGDMVGATLRMVDPNVAFTAVRASRGKVVRAEPVAALYQQGRAHHIGTFPQLEDQMTNYLARPRGSETERTGRRRAHHSRRKVAQASDCLI